MTIRIRTTPELGFLPFADGSASFTQATTTVFASVNGPMEVKPRDELPQEAFIEVIVRPAIGVAGIHTLLSLSLSLSIPHYVL